MGCQKSINAILNSGYNIKQFFFFLFLVLNNSVSSQDRIALQVNSTNWDVKKKNILRHITSFPKIPIDSIVLENGNVIKDISQADFVIMNNDANKKKVHLKLTYGLTPDKLLCIIAEAFLDEIAIAKEVYYREFKLIANNAELYTYAIQFKMGYSINSSKNTGIDEKITLRLLPTKSNGSFFENAEEYKNQKRINTDVFVEKYYSKGFTINQQVFEICIIPHPLVYPLFYFEGTNYDTRKTFLNIYQKLNNKDSLISFGILASYLDSTNKKEYLKVGSKQYEIKKIDYAEKSIELMERSVSINDSTINTTSIDLELFNLKTATAEMFSLSNSNEFTLLYFTGSWCLPCQTVRTELSRFYSKYAGVVKVIGIQKEINLTKAKEYYKENKVSWDTYFEKLKCPEDTCVSNLFSISAYPSFLLFDQKGNLILRSESDNGLKQIESVVGRLLQVKH